jgi:hypothetical protein
MEDAVRPLAEEQARGVRRAEAVATLGHLLHWSEKLDAAGPRTYMASVIIARGRQMAGSVYAILAGNEAGQQAAEDREVARGWYRRALAEWRRVEGEKGFARNLEEMKAAEHALAPGGLDSQGVGRE